MKTAVQIGAGNIGRGFMGQIFRDSGYRIVFIDVNEELVNAINSRGRYQIELVDNDGCHVKEIDQVGAVSGRNLAEAAQTIAGAEIMAVAVGVAALEKIAPMMVAGFRRRWQTGNFAPLNILVCENLIDAPGYLRRLLRNLLEPEEKKSLERTIGLVETSIGRMVPGNPPRPGSDPLTVRVEPYCKLPVDRDGFVGGFPDLKYLEPFSPFIYYIQRKLFIHNFGHAILAYLGYALGKEFIWESLEDETIAAIYQYTMERVADGLVLEHGVGLAGITDHIDDLKRRFANRALGDTTERVGRDTYRKLGPEDRVIGAYRLLAKHHLDTVTVPLIIAAGLLFLPPGDEGARRVREMLENEGIDQVLQRICGLVPGENEDLFKKVVGYYQDLQNDPRLVCRRAIASYEFKDQKKVD